MVDQRIRLVCPLIVGRDDLLDLADRRLAEVAGGRGQFLLVSGESGIGKSRLVTAIVRRATSQGMAALQAGTYPNDLEVPAAILLDLADAMDRAGPHALAGRRLRARLDVETSVDQAAVGDAHRRRRIVVLDLVDLLAGLASGGPVILVLEDLHWADDLTLEVLAGLARRLPEIPLFVIGIYRSDELYPRIPMRDWRARLLTQRAAEEIRLRRLTAEETRRMIGLILDDGSPVPSDIVEAIQARTDGIPLHVEELLGVLGADDVAVDAVTGATVPDTIEGAVLARLAQRSPSAIRLAEAASVLGQSVDFDVLVAMLGQDMRRLAGPLTELADHHILLTGDIPGRLAFRHALIRSAIYDQLSEPERRRLHLRAAEAASARKGPGIDAFLSLHLERAGRAAEAYPLALAAARSATTASSHRAARELLQRALRTIQPGPDPVAHAELLEMYARNCAAMDRNDEAAAAYEDARARYLEAGMSTRAAGVVAPLTAVRHLLGDAIETRDAALRGALAELPAVAGLHGLLSEPGEDRARAALLAGLAATYMLDRRLDEAITFGIDAEALARATGDDATQRNAATTLGSCYVFAGRMEEGWALLEAAIAGSRDSHLEAEAARGYRMHGSCASVLVEYPRADQWLREGIEYAERVELWNHRHYMAAHLGHVLWATGRWDEADALAKASLADGRGGLTTRITALHVVGNVALGRGDWPVAQAAFGEALDLGDQMKELQRRAPAIWGLAETALLSADPMEAARLVRAGLAASAAVSDAAYLFPFVVTGTRTFLAAADPGAAADWIASVEPLIVRRAIPGTLPALVHARGLLHTATGSTGQARMELEEAVAAWGALERVWEGTWARIDLARCLRRSNRRSEARAQAGIARAAAQQLGSPPLLAAADDLLRGERHADGDASAWAPLTAREFEVARLVADGGTNTSIAQTLGISPKTVSAHVEHILAKLGVDRRVEVATWVARVATDGTHPGPEPRPLRATLPPSRR